MIRIGLLTTLAGWYLTASTSAFAQVSRLNGTVSGPDGKPIAGAWVELRCDDVVLTATTDAAGTFTLDNVPTGDCQLAATRDGIREVRREVRLDGVHNAQELRLATADDPSTTPSRFISSADSIIRLSAIDVAVSPAEVGRKTGWISPALKGTATYQDSKAVSIAGFGRTWQIKTGGTYRGPLGFDLSGSVIARRGYALPLFMTDLPGNDGASVSPPTMAHSLLNHSPNPILWDTALRLEKTIKSRGTVNFRVVGEVFNPLNMNRSSNPATLISPTLTSRTFRVSAVLGF